jgi:hypothetical protein
MMEPPGYYYFAAAALLVLGPEENETGFGEVDW